MKKILSNLLIATLLAFNLSALASAENSVELATTEPEDLLPSEIQMFLKFDATKLGSILQGYLDELLDSELSTNYYDETDAAIIQPYYDFLGEKFMTEAVFFGYANEAIVAPEEATEEEVVEEVVEEVLEEETEEEAQQIEEYDDDYYYDDYDYSSPTTFGLVPMTEEEFEINVRSTLFAYETAYEEALVTDQEAYELSYYAEMVGETKVYYNSFDSHYVAYVDGYMVIADFPEDYEALTSDAFTKLTEDENFSHINSALNEANFLDFIMTDMAFIYEALYFTSDETLLTTAALAAEGIGLERTEEGFRMQLEALSNSEEEEEIKEISLHNRISASEDLIFFSNSVNDHQYSSYILEDLTYQDIAADAMEQSDIDLDVFVAAFDDEVALSIENTGSIVPDFTLLASVVNNEEFDTNLDKLLDLFWKENLLFADSSTDNSVTFIDEDFEITINRSTADGLTTYTLEIESIEKENPYVLELPEEFRTWEFTIGVQDDIFVFTNTQYPHEGGINHAGVQELLSTDANSVMYFDFQGLNGYFKDIVSLIAEIDGTVSESEVSEMHAAFDLIFGPFDSITSTGNISNKAVSAVIDFNFDLEALIDLIENADPSAFDVFNETEDGLEQITDPADDFGDVENEDWFSDDVYYLTANHVVSGYDDGEYKPANDVTRAEFLKIVLESLAGEGLIDVSNGYYSNFDDVNYYDWHIKYIDTAYREGIAIGYPDDVDEEEYTGGLISSSSTGKFYPDSPITRAEAAAILSNVIYYLGLESDAATPDAAEIFEDVDADDWFVTNVAEVYKFGVMKGMNSYQFYPNKNLNRAETAALVRNLIDLIGE